MEEIYDHYITLSDNSERVIGKFDSKGLLPNKGDIIEINSKLYDVLKRRIDYDITPPLVCLYVSKFE